MLEYWNIGLMIYHTGTTSVALHYSIVPIFHYLPLFLSLCLPFYLHPVRNDAPLEFLTGFTPSILGWQHQDRSHRK
jgi:hypothetical protein